MKLPRRRFLTLIASAAALPAASHMARAQSYPTRPVRIVVGFSAGGPNDINARLIGQWLSERLGQQFIIDNRPGASGNIAMEQVVKSPPDGYTLTMIALSSAVNATLYPNLNFNFLRDIAPVATLTRNYFVMEVHPSVPVKTGAEFIAYAKANPGALNMASPGSGTGPHMAAERRDVAGESVPEALSEKSLTKLDVFASPIRSFHTEMQSHLSKHFFDLVERLPSEIGRSQHLGFFLLYEFADVDDVVVLQAVGRPDG